MYFRVPFPSCSNVVCTKTNYMYHSDLRIYEIIYERGKPDRHCSNFPILCTFVSPGYKDFKARESKLLLYLFERYDFKRFESCSETIKLNETKMLP